MTEMTRPVSAQQQAYGEITMGPKVASNNKLAGNRAITDEERGRLLNKVTGYKDPTVFDKADKTKMDKDAFLKLLTHQLQNQDPMKPMDNDKLGADLAQFSSLEQLTNLNSKFEKFGANAQTQDQFYGASFLGKEVVTTGNTMKIKEDGASGDIIFNLGNNASKVLVRMYDSKNTMVGEMWKENIGRGNQNFVWDGTQLDGSPSIKGDYRVEIKAWDYSAEPIEVKTKVTGLVNSVYFENGETVLEVDGKKVFLRDVDSFHMPGKSGGAQQAAAAPQVNTGAAMGGILQDAKAQSEAAKNIAAKLPVAEPSASEVNLKKTPDVKTSLKAYNDQVGTGMTSVYDE